MQAGLVRRRATRGERLVGVKMGFTSEAKRAQMKIDDLIFGRLTDAMRIESAARPSSCRTSSIRASSRSWHFCSRRRCAVPLVPRKHAQPIGAVAPALEVIDSRYRDFRFSLPDVIADNSSSAAFVVGEWRALPADLTNLLITLAFDDRVLESGSSADDHGRSGASLMAAARLAGQSESPSRPAGWCWQGRDGRPGAAPGHPCQRRRRVFRHRAA